MTSPGFKIGDTKSGTALQFDSTNGEVRLTYAPAGENLAFTAALRTPSPPLRTLLDEICASAAMPDAVRPGATTRQLTRLAPRAARASKMVGRRLQHLLAWVLTSKEDTNFTYDLTQLNRAHLAALISVVSNRPVAEIEGYLNEPGTDAALAAHYASMVSGLRPELSGVADNVARWSRRIGWYAVVRALKPRCVVETGVDKGLGALLLCAALLRNASEGQTGRYIGTDINPEAGWLLTGSYATQGKILYGDSITSLKTLSQPIDVFINDSNHSADYEYAEYYTVAPLLHERSVLLGDNSHATDKLLRFATETGRRFLFFREEPVDHWYPGAGIGFAFA